jgi:hypothetical protein
MPANVSRKEAIREFKERKVRAGIFAIRCAVNGHVWVGTSRNLDATRNGSWFSLRQGGHIDKPMQAEWNEHGEPAFQYEILEVLEDDLLPMAVHDLLKEKGPHWVAKLSARPLLPG